jgi:hypothetical protein
MKKENTAARAAQTENGGENAGKSGANAKPLFWLAKRRQQPERWEYLVGLGCLALYFVLSRLTETPQFVLGIIFSFGFVCLIIGILPESMYGKIKEMKKISKKAEIKR